MVKHVFQGTSGSDLLDATGIAWPDSAVLLGLAGNDTLLGSGGNDWLLGGAGNDLLLDLGGFDAAFFSSNRADSTIARNVDGSWTIAGPEGNDTLYSVE